MNLRDLRYLVAVAEHRHFGRAAAACFVSQPTLSAQLKKLERFLGAQLVERSSKHVLLTPLGEEVAGRARTITTIADDIVETARSARDPLSGELRVGAIPTLAPYLLPHLMPALQEHLPNIRPLIREDQTARALEQLRAGQLDVCLLAVPVDGAETLASATLYEEPFLLAAPAGHPLARSATVSVDDLGGSDMLLLEEGHCLREQALSVCRRVGAGEASDFRATSLETLRQMAIAGAGITLLPEMASGGARERDGLALRPFRHPQPRRTIAALWRKGSAREPTVQALVALIRSLPVVRALSTSARAGDAPPVDPVG